MGWLKGRELWVRNGRETSGFVLVVRRALGTAVARNRLKRRLRCICRELEPYQGSLVIFPQASAPDTSFRLLRAELRDLVGRLDRSGA